jgi:copper chaperone CopZ
MKKMGVSAYVYRLVIVALLITFVVGAIASYDEAAVSYEPTALATFNSAGAPTVEFALPNLVCDDEECALAVKDILARQPGTEDVLVDVDAKTAMVAIDEGKFNSQTAIAELRDKGFYLKLATSAEFNPTGARTVEFAVPDMMCEEGCAFTVNDILSKQPGAKDVRVDFAAKTAIVAIEERVFDSQLAIAELVDKGFGNSRLKRDSSGEESQASVTGKSKNKTGIKPPPRSVSHPQGDKKAQ